MSITCGNSECIVYGLLIVRKTEGGYICMDENGGYYFLSEQEYKSYVSQN